MISLVNKGGDFEISRFLYLGGRTLSSGLPLIQEGWICYLELFLVVLSRLPLLEELALILAFVLILCSNKAICAPMGFWLLASGVEPCFCLLLRASIFLLGRVEPLPISLGTKFCLL